MRSGSGRNIKEIVPFQQNYLDGSHLTRQFKSPISLRSKNSKLSIQINKFSFNKNSIPISTPISPKEGSFRGSHNQFYQLVHSPLNENSHQQTKQQNEQEQRLSQRNSISPQMLHINRNIFTSEKKNINHPNTRKLNIQYQIYNDQLMVMLNRQGQQVHLNQQRNQVKKEDTIENQILSPKPKRKIFRSIANSRQNSIEVEKSQYKQQKVNVLETEQINRNSFKYLYALGKGGFGKVWRVEFLKEKKHYAMKEMSKARIMSKKSVNSVMNERLLLATLKHPFLANIHYAFQDRDTLYLVLDLLTGGDLRFHIARLRKFNETQTKFVIASMILCLEYLHKNNIIHRDIKPENIVLDKKGYPRLTDFGIARVMKAENSQETSGTPGYMAPEVMCRQNHSFGVDHYALGVITYEFMIGRRPYLGRNRKDIRDAVLTKQAQIKQTEIPIGWSWDAADFVNSLLQRKPSQRLGYLGIEELRNHSWFDRFDWRSLQEKSMSSPYITQNTGDELDYQREVSTDHDSQDQMYLENMILLRKESAQEIFANYEYRDKCPKY